MEVVKRSGRGYVQDPTKFFNFSRFSKLGGKGIALVEAAFEESAGWEQFDLSETELARIKSQKVVRLEFEEPNKFFLGDRMEKYDSDFHRIFTLCPYTAKWANTQQATKRRVPIFFPFNEEYIPKKQTKKYDIIYTGHIVGSAVLQDIHTISQFVYRFVSNSTHQLVTNKGASYEEKMNLIAQSKITLVHNLLYPRPYHLLNIWRYPHWREHGAFSQLPGPAQFWRFFTKREAMVVPQLKSRVFEAAFGRSLILCKRDPFNVIEQFFVPEKEFVYYEQGQLAQKIQEILDNPARYDAIAERAFTRAKKEYTTKTFFDKYLKDLA
jgi:hypothetical protein